MGIFDFITGGLSDVVSKIGNVIDSITTTDEEKIKLKNELSKNLNEFKLEFLKQKNLYEKELTERQKNDMLSDSWLSKNIRPLTLVFMLGMFTVLSLGNWAGLNVDKTFIDLLQTWGTLGLTFYFGGRSIEKIYKGKK